MTRPTPNEVRAALWSLTSAEDTVDQRNGRVLAAEISALRCELAEARALVKPEADSQQESHE